jgi:glucosyl-dolichyl phosphate glucuronosyltransferase
VTITPGEVLVEVIICTFEHERLLDLTLDHLADQQVASAAWRVTVVDNGSRDGTAQRVARHISRGHLPGLRYVVEPRRGKNHAMLRGLAETIGPWIAFVDDDCLLTPAWMRHVQTGLARWPASGALGGRVRPTFEIPPPAGLDRYGTLFAHQDFGDLPREVTSLVGAGLVVSRRAVEASGWSVRPLLPDRVGHDTGACGDLELCLRIRAAGFALRYVPDPLILHQVPAERLTASSLRGLAHGLGEGAVTARVLHASEGCSGWLRAVVSWCGAAWATALRRTLAASLRRRGPAWCAQLDRRFAAGSVRGAWRLARDASRRRELVGHADAVPPLRWRL